MIPFLSNFRTTTFYAIMLKSVIDISRKAASVISSGNRFYRLSFQRRIAGSFNAEGITISYGPIVALSFHGTSAGRCLSTVTIDATQSKATVETQIEEDTIPDKSDFTPSDDSSHLRDAFVATCKDISEYLVLDRQNLSKRLKNDLANLGESSIRDVINYMDFLHSRGSRVIALDSSEKFLSALKDISHVFYAATTSGMGTCADLLLKYINHVHSLLLQILEHDGAGHSRITIASHSLEYNPNEYSNLVDNISQALSLLLLSGCEATLGTQLLHILPSMFDGKPYGAFLSASAGSCINAAAFINAMYGLNDDKVSNEVLNFLRLSLEAISTKEMSLSTRDLFYCKLWVTILSHKHPSFISTLPHNARSFYNNVVMLEHVSERETATEESATGLYLKMRKENQQIELDCLTLEPFVFSVISLNKKEIYVTDGQECYFDAKRGERREWIRWRSLVAALNGWKVLECHLE